MMKLEAEHIFTLKVKCEKAMEIKANLEGCLKVIPIVGGTFEGKVNGTIVEGGADWNTELGNGVSHVFAKYVIKTEDDEYIGVENEGFIQWDEQTAIKTVPRFTADKQGKYAWLNSGVYVGGLKVLEANTVEITVYKMR